MLAKNYRGFSLIEVMIALVIFSILSLITTGVLYSVSQTHARTKTHSQQLGRLQLSMALLKQDLTQIVSRPIRIANHTKAAVVGETEKICFSRGGNHLPLASKKQSSLLRISYFMRNAQVIRRVYSVMDGPEKREFTETVLFAGVKQLQLYYLDKKKQLLDSWRQPNLPYALRVDITFKDNSSLSQLYPLPLSERYVLPR